MLTTTMTGTLKLYGLLALVLVGIMVTGGLYYKGRLDAGHAAQLADLQQQVAKLQATAEQERKARVLDTIQAKLDADDMHDLANRITELNDYVAAHDGACLDAADTDRLRALWGTR